LSQEVELVISSGYGEGRSVCFSHENSILATMQTKKVRLWDVKTGREIRTIVYSDNEMHYSEWC
jgi:WD40 repeat protein